MAIIFSYGITAYAQSARQHVVIAPKCLITNLSADYQVYLSKDDIYLIGIDDVGSLIAAKSHQKTPCGGFMDVTKAWVEYKTKNINPAIKAKTFLSQYTIDKNSIKFSATLQNTIYKIKYQTQVNALLKQINPQRMWDDLSSLTSMPNRCGVEFCPGNWGAKTTEWIKNQIEEMLKNNNRNDVSVYTVPTYYVIGNKPPILAPQSSVVLKIGTSSEPGIVIGSHMDDIVWDEMPTLPYIMPGADDDGSGTVTTLELARVLLNNNVRFKKPIYIIWYALEEMGLFGSQNVVDDFQKRNIPIEAVMQLDLTGYAPKNDLTMWLMDDYVDTDLTTYLEILIKEYVKQPIQHTRCGYDCSDHATWTLKGYAAVMPGEAKFEDQNPDIHTKQDTIDKLSLTHMTDFAKLALAFAVELAEPITVPVKQVH